ncbi:gluconate 2-dehydrogenase subunit 3 family protein (plasmid) [Halorussus limi]|uniref:Gluconate 2-dehydrogenase subunit 3 family protein n=1 Tax=Halorussus limi TaxID=2938695 RepID=A0A8U0HZU6_9EURY|nr:gluconate 2-dehydrogenase subunit 3 family protein [Halorussus limi]UPV76540.1 gluconate 2-dehydrogenase subunit 3 family protein [Halorussus limi]
MPEQPNDEEEPRFDFTRRSFLGNSGLAGGAMMLAGQAIETARGEDGDRRPSQSESGGDVGVDEEGLEFFDIPQARLVQAMAARIMPSDEVGPGAVELGVVYFIDEQLNSEYGVAADWYMEKPFVNRYDGAKPNQGWQSRLTPAEVYENALEWIEEYTSQRYGKSFLDLSDEQKDEVLQALDDNEVDTFRSIQPEEFFRLIRFNTIEGMYCDPMYDGNRNMDGWRMKRFPGSPGALGSYRDLIDRGEFIRIPPRDVEDDVESLGVESGSESSEAAQSSHRHGPRYELDDGPDEDDEGHHERGGGDSGDGHDDGSGDSDGEGGGH